MSLQVQAVSKDQKAPASLLVAASQYYQDRDARCETLLDSVRQMPAEPAKASGSLCAAVEDAAFAAGWVHRVSEQRQLLRAAIYGRTHAPQDVDSGLIPLCASQARILNTLHKPSGVSCEQRPPALLASTTCTCALRLRVWHHSALPLHGAVSCPCTPCCRVPRAHATQLLQAGRGTTRAQLQWLIIHQRMQYVTEVLCSSENFALAFDLASDSDLPLASGQVLLSWSRAVIDILGHDREACLAWLRERLNNAAGVSWATVAGYALVRPWASPPRSACSPAGP
jgi:hypothetical protein